MNLAAEQQFPVKWPFPPSPPTRRAWALPFARFRRIGLGMPLSDAPEVSPVVGPVVGPVAGPVVTPVIAPVVTSVVAPALRGSVVAPAVLVNQQGVGRRQMLVDILLVTMWGAMIPGLMWLGAAAGF